MFTRFLTAVLNFIITYIVILIIVAVLGMVGLGVIGAIIAPFAYAIAVIVGILTFFEAIPNYFNGMLK